MTRREFLKLSGATAGGLVAAGIGGWLADRWGWADISFGRSRLAGTGTAEAGLRTATPRPISAAEILTATSTTEVATATSTAAVTPETTAWPLPGREAVTEGYPISRFLGFHSDFQGGSPTGEEMATWAANVDNLKSAGLLQEGDIFTTGVLQALYNGQMLSIEWQEGVITEENILQSQEIRMGMLADVKDMPPVFHEQIEKIVAQKLGIGSFQAITHADTIRIFSELLNPYGFFQIGTLFPSWGLEACQVIMDRPGEGESVDRNSQDPAIVRARWDNRIDLGGEWIEITGVSSASCPTLSTRDRLSNQATLGAMIHIVEDDSKAAMVYGKLLELQKRMGLSENELRIATVTRGPGGVGYIFLALVDYESRGPLWPEEQNPNRDGSFNLVVPCGCPVTAPEATVEATRKATAKPTKEKLPETPAATTQVPATTAAPTEKPTKTVVPSATIRPSATPQPPEATTTPGPTPGGTPTQPATPTERPTWTPRPTTVDPTFAQLPASPTPHLTPEGLGNNGSIRQITIDWEKIARWLRALR